MSIHTIVLYSGFRYLAGFLPINTKTYQFKNFFYRMCILSKKKCCIQPEVDMLDMSTVENGTRHSNFDLKATIQIVPFFF